MTRTRRCLGLGLALLPTILLAGACGNGAAQGPQPPQAVTIGPESVARVERGELRTGPLISGELRPEREATVRAEVGGSILDVLVEEGQPVRQGALLVRIEEIAETSSKDVREDAHIRKAMKKELDAVATAVEDVFA